MLLLVCMDVCFPRNCLYMLSYEVFQMQYDLLYNHITYLGGMIYLNNKIETQITKLIK